MSGVKGFTAVSGTPRQTTQLHVHPHMHTLSLTDTTASSSVISLQHQHSTLGWLQQGPVDLQLLHNLLQHGCISLVSRQPRSSGQLAPAAVVVVLAQQHSRQLAPHLQQQGHTHAYAMSVTVAYHGDSGGPCKTEVIKSLLP